jgi:hypothetical protein
MGNLKDILVVVMPRKIKTLDEAPVDVIESIKRGLIHRGFIPGKYRRNSPLEESESPQKKTAKKARSKNESQEASKDAKEPEPGETHEKLIDLTEKAQDILFTADTVFPFTLFPDTITLDREKLTVVERFFYRVAKVITVPISSMISAEANVGPFFGSVHMTSKYFIDNTHTINFLWRHDAEEVHRMIQGFIIAQEKKIDVTEIDKDDLKVLLNDLGHGTNE